jgi:hypothetical protein
MDGTAPDSDDSSVRRRRFVKGLGALSVVGLAGCGGSDGTETLNTVTDSVATTGMTGTPTPTGTGTSTSTDMSTPTDTPTPTETPVNPALPSGAPQRSNAEAYFSLNQDSLPATNELNGEDTTNPDPDTGNDTTNDPTPGVDGQAGTAFDFDGDEDHIEYSNLGIDYSGSADWTTSLWINPDSIPDSGEVSPWHPRGQNDIWLGLWNNGEITLGTFNFDDSVTRVFSGAQLGTDSWTHITVVSDTSDASSDEQYKIYFDGSLEASSNLPDPADQGANNVIGGKPLPFNQDYFDGQIDEVYIYSAALSSTEVSELYNTAT